MPIDPKYLREQYAFLSNEALMAIDRADLVETAQRCYDEEVARRRLASPTHDDDKPAWLDDASEVFSRVDVRGTVIAPDIAAARDALEAEGIPCHLDLAELPQDEEPHTPPPTHVWRVLVPGNFNFRAASVLDRDIFNADFEEDWRVQIEMLSDAELLEMKPEVVFCGLFDRIERVTRSYDAEIARRKL
jgi:hypothetical protein